MPSFTDKDGRQWQLRIDAPSIMEIRAECDPKFLLNDGEGDNNTFARLRGDPVTLCRVIYILCQEQRDNREVKEKDFYLKVLGDGDAIQGAAEALSNAIVSFSQPWMRDLLKAFTAEAEIRQEAIKMVTDKIADPQTKSQFNAALENALAEVMRKNLTPLKSATDTPDSSESAPEA